MTEQKVSIPAAPQNLPAPIQKQWQRAFADALPQAKVNHPDNPKAQRSAAVKAANRMLAVPVPESAADIDALPEWQVLARHTRTVAGIETRHCVTIDGRKHSFAIEKATAPESIDLSKMTKDELVKYAASAHDLTFKAGLTKDEMIAGLEQAAASK